jgi:hypothetical protein
MQKVFSFMLALLMLLVLASCGVDDDTKGDEQQEAQPDVELEIGKIVDIYEKALEAYSWFDLTTMPIDSYDSKEADGMVYHKVNHDTIKTYADLEVYLRSLFADNIVDGLLDQAGVRYREFDGVLYAIPADRGADITKGEYILSFDRVSDLKVKCIIEVELLDENDLETVIGHETHEYNLELIDGEWVFTNFDLFY